MLIINLKKKLYNFPTHTQPRPWTLRYSRVLLQLRGRARPGHSLHLGGRPPAGPRPRPRRVVVLGLVRPRPLAVARPVVEVGVGGPLVRGLAAGEHGLGARGRGVVAGHRGQPRPEAGAARRGADGLAQPRPPVAEPHLHPRLGQLRSASQTLKRYTSEPPPPYFCATSSLVYTSGYCVFWKYCSSISSWSVVKVVRARRTFRRSVSPGSVSTSDSSLVSPPAQ